VGDFPKPPDDAAWTEVERSFFAAAPPEEPQLLDEPQAPAPRRPRSRRAAAAWLRPAIATARRGAALVAGAAGGLARRAGRKTILVVAAAGARARGAARAGAASLADGLALWRVDRRVVLVLMAATAAGWVSTGSIARRSDPSARDLTVEREAPRRAPAVAEAEPVPAVAPGTAAVPPARQPSPGSSHPPRGRRSFVQASSPAQRPVQTAFMDRRTYWAQEGFQKGFKEGRSAPVRASRPFFSR